jgi:hypothetical protein
MNSNNIALWTALMAAACSACAPLPGPQGLDWQHGARRGAVAAIYSPATPVDALPRCLAEKSAAERAAHRYARVEYRHVRHKVSEVAELPDGATLGDQVELWPQKCAQGQLSRIAAILPRRAN